MGDDVGDSPEEIKRRNDIAVSVAQDVYERGLSKSAPYLFVETHLYIEPIISFTGRSTENPSDPVYQMYLADFLAQLGIVIAQDEADGVWFRGQPEFDTQRQQVKVLARVTAPRGSDLEGLVEDIMRIQEDQGPVHQKSVLGTVVCSRLEEVVNESLAAENLGARSCAEKWGTIYIREQ